MTDPHRPRHLHPDNSLIFLTGRVYGGFSYFFQETMKDYLWQLMEEKAAKFSLDLQARVLLDNHYHLLCKTSQGAKLSPFVNELHGASANKVNKSLLQTVINHSQIFVSGVTPWDKRQTKRLREEFAKEWRRTANSQSGEVLARFIARYGKMLKPKDYRALNAAIADGRITDPEVIFLLLSRKRPVWYQYTDHVIRNEADYYRHLNYLHQNPVKHGVVTKMSAYHWSSLHDFVKEKGKEWLVECFREYPVTDFKPEGIAD